MKRLMLLLASAVLILGMLESCNKCRGIDCENGGTCNDGECDCLKGYFGENCELKDICILNDVVCVYGECNEGTCFCNEGIELPDCSREARQKFIGKYIITEYVDGLDTVVGTEISMEKDLLNVPDIYIYNLFNYNQFPINGFYSKVRAVAQPNTKKFNIPRQAPDDTDKEIDGFGTIAVAPDSSIIELEIQYTIYSGNKEYPSKAEGQLIIEE